MIPTRSPQLELLTPFIVFPVVRFRVRGVVVWDGMVFGRAWYE